MDEDLFVDLHTLSVTPVVVCRRLVLQQALKAVGLSMHETTTRYDESQEVLTDIRIHVPPHVRIPRLKTNVFYGDWSPTAEAAIQSACFNVLLYLQEENIVNIDCIHSAELECCQRKLLEATSWSEAFQSHAAKLLAQLDAGTEKREVPIPKECANADPQGQQVAASDALLTPARPGGVSSSARIPDANPPARRALVLLPNAMEPAEQTSAARMSSGVPAQVGEELISAPLQDGDAHAAGVPFVPRRIRRLRWIRQRRNPTIPTPLPALAKANRTKRRLLLDSSRSRTAEYIRHIEIAMMLSRESKEQAGKEPAELLSQDTTTEPGSTVGVLPLPVPLPNNSGLDE